MLLVLAGCGASNDSESTTSAMTTEAMTIEAAMTTEAMTTEAMPTEADESTEATESTSEATTEASLPVFTADTLAEFDGKEGRAAYVGYEGQVYDVSDIPAWKDGIHQGKYTAGQDLTDVLNNIAPHAPTNLTDNAPVVGLLE